MTPVQIVLWVLLPLLAVLATLRLWYGNNRLTVSHYVLRSGKLAAPVRIVQLSDLHNKRFGKDNARLKQAVLREKPDLLVFTGDLEDRRRPYCPWSVHFLTELAQSVPVYFVLGNQEMRGGFAETVSRALRDGGVTVLNGETVTVPVRGQMISMLGLNDYASARERVFPYAHGRALLRGFEQSPGFRLLLTHYPHYFARYRRSYQYSRYRPDLTLAGHAHGGLIRLPFFGGVIAPGQGLFPYFTAGLYTEGGADMIVSRGLGNSGLPFRINNPPEIVVADILPTKP